MTTRKHTDTLTAHSNMLNKLFLALFSLFLLCSPVMSQKQVTIDRTKLAQDRNRKEAARKQAEARKKEAVQTEAKKQASRRRQKKKVERPQVATYLRVNNVYSDNVTKNVWYSYKYETFKVYTDGKAWNVSMLPFWCTVSDRTSSSFTLCINENYSYDSRRDWLLVSSDSKQVKVYITQDGKPINVSASVNNVRLTHDMTIKGKKSMLVSGNFNIVNGQGLTFYAVAMIKEESGNNIEGSNSYPTYRMQDGSYYATSDTFNNSNHTNNHSFSIVIPTDSFNPGYKKKNKLTVVVALYCIKKGEFISGTTYTVPFVAKRKKKGITTMQK